MQEVIKEVNNLNKYYFQGIRFIPGYNDFDYDDFTTEALTSEEAWKELDNCTKLSLWKTVGLIEINDSRYYESV